jgi:hypothetical protein
MLVVRQVVTLFIKIGKEEDVGKACSEWSVDEQKDHNGNL